MSLPLHDRAHDGGSDTLVRMTLADLGKPFAPATIAAPALIPDRPLLPGEQYRFHFNMTKCIGCRSCEIACNEHWPRRRSAVLHYGPVQCYGNTRSRFHFELARLSQIRIRQRPRRSREALEHRC